MYTVDRKSEELVHCGFVRISTTMEIDVFNTKRMQTLRIEQCAESIKAFLNMWEIKYNSHTILCQRVYQWCKQDQILKTKTKTTGSKQRHLADLSFK